MSTRRHPIRDPANAQDHQSRRSAIAKFVLLEASRLGLRVGSNGHELLVSPPRDMSNETYFDLQRRIAAYRIEIIEIILREGKQ